MGGDYRTRRGLLRSGLGLAAATTAGLSGCLGRFDAAGDPGTESFERWLPDHAELGGEGETYVFATLDVAGVVENGDRFDGSEYDRFLDRFDRAESVLPAADAVDAVTGAVVPRAGADLQVVEGSFSRGAAVDAVTGAGLERTGEHAGYDLYRGSRGVFGVREGVVAGSRSGREDADDLARTVLDAGRGEAERLVAADPAAERLVAALGSGLNAVGLVGPANVDEGYGGDAVTGVGRSVRLAGGGATVELVLVYDDAGDVDVDAVEATAGEDRQLMGPVRDVSASASGRVARATGSVDAERLAFDGFTVTVGPDPAERPPTPPAASFAFEYDPDAGVVTITHAGGEAFTADDTGGLLYGRRSDGMDSLREWELPVRAGDSVTLPGVDSGHGVVVVWESPAGDRMPVGTYGVP